MVKFYSQNNSPKFNELFKVPDRIPALTEKLGKPQMGKIIMAEITKFMNCFTVVRPMNEDQIAQCAFALITTADEDNLSLQDLIIFFEGAKQFKYGRVLDHVDQMVIFEMLEVYRESRHAALLNIRDESHSQSKSDTLGIGRSSDDKGKEMTDMRTVMVDYYKNSVIKENEK